MGHFVRDQSCQLAIIQIKTPNVGGAKYKFASREARGRLIRLAARMHFPAPGGGGRLPLNRLRDEPCGDLLHTPVEIGLIVELTLAAQLSQKVTIGNLRLRLHRVGRIGEVLVPSQYRHLCNGRVTERDQYQKRPPTHVPVSPPCRRRAKPPHASGIARG